MVTDTAIASCAATRPVSARPLAAAALLVAASLASPPSLGQERGQVTVDVERCLELQSAEERQACFGSQVDRALQASGSAETAASIPAGEADGPAEARDPATSAAEQTLAREAADPGDLEYTGTIVEIDEYLPSAYIITLDNGQVWEQTEPKRYPLRPGLEVRIYPTRWGSRYRLTGLDSGGHIQVRRIR